MASSRALWGMDGAGSQTTVNRSRLQGGDVLVSENHEAETLWKSLT